jgi:hypothetical protein
VSERAGDRFLRWPLEVLGWSAVLVVPCWLVSEGYERGLATVVKRVVDSFGHSLRIDRLEVFAPLEIGIFVSLCLASRAAPAWERARAIALGIPALAVLEVLVLLGATFLNLSRQSGALAGEFYEQLPLNLVKSIGWVNALVLWMAFLGRWELPS